LALDFGKKRIGLAVTDGLGLTAQGLPTLERQRVRDDLAHLAKLAQEREVAMFLMGDPRHLNGEAGRGSEKVRAFGARLEEATGIPVTYWDERLTSVAAHEVLNQAGVRGQDRKGAVDRIAAAVLLRSYLDAMDDLAYRQQQELGDAPESHDEVPAA
jgi:putative Holliday junction resolvase